MKKIRAFLVFLLPVVLFFSYYPVIRLGASETMNFELSLPLIWLFFFSVTSLLDFWKVVVLAVKRKLKWWWGVLLACLVPLWGTISILWSGNQIRGVLTAGILWCLVISGVGIVKLIREMSAKKRYGIILLFLGGTLVVCAFCIIQCFADVLGISRGESLACMGCTYHSFGFPHPSGFAIEPQFMGNLMLAPIFVVIGILWKTKGKTGKNLDLGCGKVEVTEGQKKGYWLMLFVFLMTLFLTFSRGAIYAYGVGLVVFVVILAIKKRFALGVIVTTVVAFLAALTMQGVLTEIAPTSENFVSGVTKSVHQLTLGVVDLRGLGKNEEKKDSSGGDSEVVFDGYVAESTDTRVKLTDVALATWSSSPVSAVFGVGLGGAGVAMNRQFPEKVSSPKEIVQNQYASVLLELGIFGLILVIVVIIIWLKMAYSSVLMVALIPLIVAYLVSLFFFAGLPNALHIYLMPVMLVACFCRK